MNEIVKTEDVMKGLKVSKPIAKGIMKLLKLDQLNAVYDRACPNKDLELLEAVLKNEGIVLDFDENELKNIPEYGPFIAVANHPFGFWDGLLFVYLLNKARKGTMVTANFLLKRLEAISHYIIEVNPFEGKGKKRMGAGAKVLKALSEGTPVGLFPAGEVSTYYDGFSKPVRDKEWGISSMRLVHKAGVPVVPVYFFGSNSSMFHYLGKIHPLLRTLRLPTEFMKKRNQTIKVRIGKPIPIEKLHSFENEEEMGLYIRKQLYSLADEKQSVAYDLA